MDGILFVTLLLTGLWISFTSQQSFIYFFINEGMTWDAARKYCAEHHAELAQTYSYNTLSMAANTQNAEDEPKAWIGLLEELSPWRWSNGRALTYSRWKTPPESADSSVTCATTEEGIWKFVACSEERVVVCQEDDDEFQMLNGKRTWFDAVSSCKSFDELVLTIPDDNDWDEFPQSMKESEVWLGLRRVKFWSWSESGRSADVLDQPEEPEEPEEPERCGAILLDNGTLTAEDCSNKFPFFCYDVVKVKRNVMKMNIESDADMEDQVWRDELLQQLRLSFADHGLGDVKLTWKKVPEKKVKKESRCD